ncbi:endo-1,4-beta-xylanase [Laspinema palackyanum]|uniref:endo-1,4-beta-xylanase n=1 Tax=Laspinema palackyanum TaxID=3231601 RepID=UPI00345D9EA0|nr:endo-1,4-beta-xylanase [Laspinema sp. D2c]
MSLRAIIPSGFYLGATSNYKILSNDLKLQELVSENFNLITSDNDFKLGTIARCPDEWNFESSDWFVDFATNAKLKVRGHLMIWARSIPEWLRDMDSQQFRDFLKNYLEETLSRYPSIVEWDICGEAIEETGLLRESFLSYHLGNEWAKTCLIWARNIRPDAKLFYSEYRLQGYRKQKGVLSLIDNYLREGNILDGLGVQLHHNTLGTFRLFGFKDFLKTIESRGLKIHFSEVTVWDNTSLSKHFGELSQAVAYSELFRLCRDCGSEVFNIWGTTDRYSWRSPEFTPFLFNRDYQPKPAYFAMKDALSHFEGMGS